MNKVEEKKEEPDNEKQEKILGGWFNHPGCV